MELLEYMPEKGAFKTAARGGEFSREEKIWAQIANELAVLRAAYVPKAQADKYESRIWFSLARLREMIEEAEAQDELRESFYAFATRDPVDEEVDV
jgi:hypothetical protein